MSSFRQGNVGMCEKHSKLNQCFLCVCVCVRACMCPVFIESKQSHAVLAWFILGQGESWWGVMGVFGEIEMDLELFSGEIRPYGSEWELWTCLSLELEEGQVGEVTGGGFPDRHRGYFGCHVGWEAEGVWIDGEYLKRESWLSGSLAEIAGLKWAVVQFHCLTYLNGYYGGSLKVWRREREREMRRSWTLFCLFVSVLHQASPQTVQPATFSTKLIKLCQTRSLESVYLSFYLGKIIIWAVL